MPIDGIQVCARCVYDARVPGISFDAAGICNYCRVHDEMDAQYPVGAAGDLALEQLAERVRRDGRGKDFDCVVGVSGGCDSSYMLLKMVELGLRPLAVHFDNTWNSPIATQNIYNVLEVLKVELSTYVVNNSEYDDIYRSFLMAGVKDIESPTDIGLTTVLYQAAEKHHVRYIIEGHSFRTEGVAPLGWIYMDGRYIADVHARFGQLPMKTFPNLWMKDFLRWATVRNIKRIRPLYHMDYRKEDAKALLTRDFGWEWYGGHHLENRFTAFFHTYFLPKRYGIDARLLGHAALVRSGQMSRDDALLALKEPIVPDMQVVDLVKKRLELTTAELDALLEAPQRHYSDYRTYKATFERLRPLFWLLYRADRVPRSFYMKFTRPDPSTPVRPRVPAPKPVIERVPSLPTAD
jgi:N-acetyl sugar amidotransferase